MRKTFFAYKDKMTARYTQDGKRVAATWFNIPTMSVVGPRNTSTLFKLQVSPKTSKFKEIKNPVNLHEDLKVGTVVNVTNATKGRGFAGGVKRWSFAGGPRTHGQSDREKAPGSSGGGTRMGRLYKGRHAPGKMGNHNVQVRNLTVLEVDMEKNKMLISGMIPGSSLTLSRIEIVK